MENEDNAIWPYSINQEEVPSSGHNGTHKTFEFDLAENNECSKNIPDIDDIVRGYKKLLYDKLRISKISSVSISPMSNNIPHVLNLKQEFTFPQTNFPAQKDEITQTAKLVESRIKTPYPYAAKRDLDEDQTLSRPQSYPMSIPSNHNFHYAPHVTVVNNRSRMLNSNENIGDGIENNLNQIKCNIFELESQKDTEFELGDAELCENSVQCVIIKQK